MTIFIIGWLITSMLTYGYIFGFMQREYPTLAKDDYVSDVNHALLMSIIPFVGIIVVLILGRYKHGLKFK